MDQIKIGKFISQRRRAVGLTQQTLAERLNITDRAVSKWETGRAMPDSSLMLPLCGILGIHVQDLLNGEVVGMENYSQETEKKLLELIKEKEATARRMLSLQWVILTLSLLVFIVPAVFAAFLPNLAGWQITLISLSGLIPCLIGCSFILKIEQVAGYYACEICGNKYTPTYAAVLCSMHMGRTRYMKCPHCHKRSWQKKILTKEEE